MTTCNSNLESELPPDLEESLLSGLSGKSLLADLGLSLFENFGLLKGFMDIKNKNVFINTMFLR